MTSLIETAAAAVGATMLLAAFLVGFRGVIEGWPRHVLEGRTLEAAYLGGFVGITAILADIILRAF